MFPYNPVIVFSTLVCFIVAMLVALFGLAFLVTILGEATNLEYEDIDDEEGAHTRERSNKTAR
jgi:hypothetical protein